MTFSNKRRQFIQSSVAGCVLMAATPSQLLAKTIEKPKKLVWVMLRGAMDSLHAVVPTSDPDLMKHRGSLVTPIADKLLPLDANFALHPAFKNLHKLYHQKHFAPVVAVASSYRNRSHFDGQDHMEGGLDRISYDSGWLARVLAEYQGEGLAISRVIPIALRGAAKNQSWYPSQFKPAEQDFLSRLSNLYENDDQFSNWLNDAVSSRELIGTAENKGKPSPNFEYLAEKCGTILTNNPNASCAMLEMGGWDTHNSQVNRLNRQFSELDNGILALKNALGSTWQDTVVLVTTEFGRTVAVNGTKGTDHGTGAAMFIVGGAVKGGSVLGNWPGLASDALYENRDLMPTSDVRSWISAVLHQHLRINNDKILTIFPGVESVKTSIIS